MTDRRLTAIVFTDIVGYSAIVHRDEVLGAQLLDRQREVVRRLVPQYGGREVETAGDSFLLEFGSALAAVGAVIAIQSALGRDPREPRVVLRAGVHLGDVDHRGREVYGDGVNIAARVMPLSPEGGMALSAPVLALVRQRMQLPARSIGTPALKNISSPVEIFVVYAADLGAMEVPAPDPDAAIPVVAVRAPPKRALAAAGIAALVMAAGVALWRVPWRAVSAEGRSVAVLPFVNQSEDKANAYFADGMQDEILTALAKIKALKVISRTSVEQYRDKPHDLKSIAKALGVAAVLEGGVQRAGNRVRINVQLIDAHSDAHLWADTYDRDVADVFAVQSEVARQVASALQATLAPAESARLAVAPTQNAKAYDLYLQANQVMRVAGDFPEELVPAAAPKAIELYLAALDADPGFALASARLAATEMNFYWFGQDKDPELLAGARSRAERAIVLKPDMGEAHAALGLYYYWGHRDYLSAEKELETARQALPNDSLVVRVLGAVNRRRGRLDEALRDFSEAATLNPQDVSNWLEIGNTNFLWRRYADAEAAYTRAKAVATNPAELAVLVGWVRFAPGGDLGPIRAAVEGMPNAHPSDVYYVRWLSRDFAGAVKAANDAPADWLLNFTTDIFMPRALLAARAHQALGDAAAARQAYEQSRALLEQALKQRPEDADLHTAMGLTLAGLGQAREAVDEGEYAVELLPAAKDALNGPMHVVYLAEIYARTGDRERALQTLQQAVTLTSGVIACPGILKTDPAWDPVRSDPRFQALAVSPPSLAAH